MPQPLPLKNAISLPFTTTFPFDWPKAYVLPASLIVPAVGPRGQTPESAVGTGPPLGHGSADADGLGEGKLVTVAAVAPAADDAGAPPPPHPPRTKIARTSAPFLIPLLLPPCSRKGRGGKCWPIAGRFHRGNYVQRRRYGRRSVAPC